MSVILGSTNWHVPLDNPEAFIPDWGSNPNTIGVGFGNLFDSKLQTIYDQSLFFNTNFGTTATLKSNTESQFLWFYISFKTGKFGDVVGFLLGNNFDCYVSLYDSNNKIICKNKCTIDESIFPGGAKVKLSKWDTKNPGLYSLTLTLINKTNQDSIDIYSGQRIDIIIV